MAEGQGGEKTEEPTPKKIKDSRKEGQIPRSNDFGGWFGVLALTAMAPLGVHYLLTNMGAGFTKLDDTEMDQLAMLTYLSDMSWEAIKICAPVVLFLGLINVAAQFAQVRWTPKKLKFDWKKLNPISGIKNLLKPTRMAWETIKNLLKIAAVTYVCYNPAVELIHVIISVGVKGGAKESFALIGQAAIGLLQTMVIVGIAIAAVDYLVSRYQIRQQIKMSKQEIKEEYKQQEGDPHVKGQRRARQMAMSRNRMMAATADATAVTAVFQSLNQGIKRCFAQGSRVHQWRNSTKIIRPAEIFNDFTKILNPRIFAIRTMVMVFYCTCWWYCAFFSVTIGDFRGFHPCD